MVSLFERFKGTERYSTFPDIALEPTARLPYALFGPTVVTHFPLFYKSHEDDNFEQRALKLRNYWKDAESHLTLHDKIRTLIIKDIQVELAKLPQPDALTRIEVDQAVFFVWFACQIAFARTVDKEPELFIFSANTKIRLELNRFAHRAVVRAIISEQPTHVFSDIFDADVSLFKPAGEMPNLNIWHRNHRLSAQAFWICNCTVYHFSNGIIGASTLHAAAAAAAATHNPPLPGFEVERKPFLQQFRQDFPIELPTKPEFPPQKRLGGLISWFDAITNDQPLLLETALPNRKLFALDPVTPVKWRDSKKRIDPLIDNYLIWRRGEGNWRYTFFDGCYEYPNNGIDKIRNFLRKLLQSSTLLNSFPEIQLNNDFHSAFDKYPFPGSRIAGALYFVIPAELLVIMSAHIRELLNRFCSGNSGPPHAIIDHQAMTGRVFDDCLNELQQLEESMWSDRPPIERPPQQPLQAKPEQQFAAYVKGGRASVQRMLKLAKETGVRIASLYDWISYGIERKAAEAPELQKRFHQCFVDIAEILWKNIYGAKEFVPGQDDFVSSSVIDGRAIYFSNFRPFETSEIADSLGFTRTFFIDFRLTPYQRGRLVRRLCDVATFRMSCVRDIDRIHALSDGISQINEDFNLVVSKSASLESSRDEETISNALSDALVLYQRALEFNMFITEGISGRKSAALGDWSVVQRQIADIRESRLEGRPQLGDFLERGLGLSILEIRQIADRYENLVHRINSHMSTIRTRLVGVHTTNIASIMSNCQRLLENNDIQSRQQISILKKTEVILEEAKDLSTKQTQSLDQQTKLLAAAEDVASRQISSLDKQTEFLTKQTELLSAADLLVWLGGTYYLWSMLEDLANLGLDRVGEYFGVTHLSDFAISKIGLRVVILGVVFVLVYWFKQKLWNFAQGIKAEVRTLLARERKKPGTM